MLGFSPDEWTAILLSLRVATIGTLAGLPVALFAAYALARWRFPGKIIVDGVLHLPLVLPPVVTGYLLLLTFGRQGAVGKELYELFGITFSFRWTGAALACGVMGFPLMLRAIRLSFEAIDRRLETAAGTLGANPYWTFFLITMPTQTIPSAIYTYTQVPGGEGQALRLTFVSIAIAMVALIVSEVLNRRIQKRIAVFE